MANHNKAKALSPINGISLSNSANSAINFNQAGVNPPTLNTRSAGTKIVLYTNVSATTSDFAFGIENACLWSSVPANSCTFKWYAGATQVASLDGTGIYTANAISANSYTVTGTSGVYLNNGTSNLIAYNNAGLGAPTFNTRSAGTKIVLWGGITSTAVDYAIGMAGSTLWFSVPDASEAFRWYGGQTNVATLTGAGAFSAVSVTQTSDARLKSNIATLGNALQSIMQLRGVTYDRISTGKHEIGVIAQEVLTVLPELVSVGDDELQTLSVAYGNITAVLIEAVKELKEEKDTEILALRSENELLQERLSNVETQLAIVLAQLKL